MGYYCKSTTEFMYVWLPVPECVQYMVGSQALVKPRMFAPLFEMTLELPASLLSWTLGHIINTPKVLQGQHPCQEQTHTHAHKIL